MIDSINWLGNGVGRVLLHPFDRVSPWMALSVASLYLAILALLAFKFGSNQAALKRRKEQALARLLELQLFKDDLLGIFGTVGRILAAVGCYLLESLKPLVVMAVPLAILLIQVAGWLPVRPLKPGEPAVLTVSLDRSLSLTNIAITATASEGIAIETEPFVSSRNHEVLWRIRPDSSGRSGWVEISVNGAAMRKSVSVGQDRLSLISVHRVRGGKGARLLNPLEPALPADTPIQSIAIDYPPRKFFLGSRKVDPWAGLFVLSLALGLLLKRPFRVEF